MKKILVAILQYNTFELTDSLFETLKPFENDLYDLIVVDNGSLPEKRSKYTTHFLDKNAYYGGGLNAILGLFINSNYEYVMVLNNDIICHGENYVKTLYEEMISGGFDIISPSVLEPHTGPQTCWRPMRTWHSATTREVPWVDYQAPMLSRRFVEAVYPFNPKLNYGWGQDVLSGIVCKRNNWKIGVSDKVTVIHLISQTLKLNPDTLSDVNNLAEKNMFEYFQSLGGQDYKDFLDMRNQSFSYKYNS